MPYKTVVFDFDSTLVTIEGINELARMKGVTDQVEALTHQAMNGQVAFHDVFFKRLDLIKPEVNDFDALARLYLKNLTPGAIELVKTLKLKGIDIHIVSGGYEQAILPIALFLGITPENVHTIRLKPNTQGYMVGVAHNQSLLDHAGKKNMVASLHLPRRIAFVGDGATDLITRDVVDTFVGFGGVAVRDTVRHHADIYTTNPSLASLIHILKV